MRCSPPPREAHEGSTLPARLLADTGRMEAEYFWENSGTDGEVETPPLLASAVAVVTGCLVAPPSTEDDVAHGPPRAMTPPRAGLGGRPPSDAAAAEKLLAVEAAVVKSVVRI